MGTHPLQTELFSEAYLTLPSKHPLSTLCRAGQALRGTGQAPGLSWEPEVADRSRSESAQSRCPPAWQTHGIRVA